MNLRPIFLSFYYYVGVSMTLRMDVHTRTHTSTCHVPTRLVKLDSHALTIRSSPFRITSNPLYVRIYLSTHVQTCNVSMFAYAHTYIKHTSISACRCVCATPAPPPSVMPLSPPSTPACHPHRTCRDRGRRVYVCIYMYAYIFYTWIDG